ncbi:LysR family transcriptional regulator [Bartonella sp. HY406]|uniref:LysR family transcriptional regulator n=1 Tax=Bartonella sp. HY406 TaxID=2979331 RepID=UPI0021C75616|nr:LysR family transcriptional regulator [Bartonella sp. HY406]UXN04204.1 LysR family transcriptional regulator [Bartonella sp. HY406]
MNWDDLRIFLSVARNSQLLKAAKQLGVNHTTISRRLTALEHQLNTKLVTRSTTGTQLTDAGERLLHHVEQVEAQMLQAQAQIGGEDVQLSGTIRIAAPDGFGVSFLAKHLPQLSEKFPDLTLQLVPVSRNFSLSQREADIAITVERPAQGRLIAKKLTDYKLRLYAHKDYLKRHGHPLDIHDILVHHRKIDYVDDLISTPALAYSHEISEDWHSNFQVSSTLGQLEAIIAGGGIGILHSYIARTYPDLVVVLPEKAIIRSYWLSYHENLKGIRRIHEVANFISQSIETNRAAFL